MAPSGQRTCTTKTRIAGSEEVRAARRVTVTCGEEGCLAVVKKVVHILQVHGEKRDSITEVARERSIPCTGVTVVGPPVTDSFGMFSRLRLRW